MLDTSPNLEKARNKLSWSSIRPFRSAGLTNKTFPGIHCFWDKATAAADRGSIASCTLDLKGETVIFFAKIMSPNHTDVLSSLRVVLACGRGKLVKESGRARSESMQSPTRKLSHAALPSRRRRSRSRSANTCLSQRETFYGRYSPTARPRKGRNP